jgi:lipoate-protein ligase A
MRSFAERKVLGGKLVGVELEHGSSITRVRITGDFFIYPEESLQKIETSLVGLSASADLKEIVERISRVVAKEKAELIGVTPEAIAVTMLKAVSP